MKKRGASSDTPGTLIVCGDPSSPHVFHVIKGNGEGAISIDGRIHPLDLAPFAHTLKPGDRAVPGLPERQMGEALERGMEPEPAPPKQPPKKKPARSVPEMEQAIDHYIEKTGLRPTQEIVAHYAKRGRRTVQRHWAELERYINERMAPK